MNQRFALILVLGGIVLAAVISIALESKWGKTAAIDGTIAIAGAAVGALATLAGSSPKEDNFMAPTPAYTPPKHGWPEQTTRENEIG
jgi:hypothetical protein